MSYIVKQDEQIDNEAKHEESHESYTFEGDFAEESWRMDIC